METGLFTLALNLARRILSLVWNLLQNFVSFQGGVFQEILLLVGIWIVIPIVLTVVEKCWGAILWLLKKWE